MVTSPLIDVGFLERAKQLGAEGFLSLSEEEQEKLLKVVLAPSNDIIEHKCKNDVLYWLQEKTKTNNPQYQELGLPYQAPFPKKDYFVKLFEAFAKWPRLFLPKTRDMLTSLSVIGFSTHRAQWFREETIVQTASEDKAAELVGYAVNFWDNQDECLKRRHPLRKRSVMELAYEEGGRLMAIPSGEDKIRMFHPTRYVQDESAFLPDAQQCYDAAHPVCQQIICISSAGPGWFGNQCSPGAE